MIDKLTPRTRKLLVKCRCTAMHGLKDGAIRILDEYIESHTDSFPVLDQVAIAMLKAEILYLDCQETEALNVFTTYITPKIDQLPYSIRIIIEDNLSAIRISIIDEDSANHHYLLADAKRLAGINLWNAHSIIVADDAAAEGKHYLALPRYWRQLVNTYYLGCWRSYAWVSECIGKECIAQ